MIDSGALDPAGSSPAASPSPRSPPRSNAWRPTPATRSRSWSRSADERAGHGRRADAPHGGLGRGGHGDRMAVAGGDKVAPSRRSARSPPTRSTPRWWRRPPGCWRGSLDEATRTSPSGRRWRRWPSGRGRRRSRGRWAPGRGARRTPLRVGMRPAPPGAARRVGLSVRRTLTAPLSDSNGAAASWRGASDRAGLTERAAAGRDAFGRFDPKAAAAAAVQLADDAAARCRRSRLTGRPADGGAPGHRPFQRSRAPAAMGGSARADVEAAIAPAAHPQPLRPAPPPPPPSARRTRPRPSPPATSRSRMRSSRPAGCGG